MENLPSKKHLVEHIGELQKELFDKEGLKLEVEWLEYALKKRTRLLDERAKELTCTMQALKTLREPGLSFDQRMQRIVEALPRAWQYPGNACARLEVIKWQFQTANWAETPWNQRRDIIADGKKWGFAVVGYLCEKPDADEGPFLREERMLLEVVCECLGMFLERNGGLLLPLSPKSADQTPNTHS